MNNIDTLLNEYEQKRRNAEMDLEKRIVDLYKKFPQLEDIDDKINKIAITKTKAILYNQEDIEKLNIQIENLKNQREEFIKNNNIDKNIFEPDYECKTCKDTGYVYDENKKMIMCNCLKQRLLNISYNKSNLSDIKNDNFQNFNINIYSDEINTEKYRIKCSPRQNIIGIKQAGIKFIQNFDDLEQKNLLFIRKYGAWKNIHVQLYSKRIVKKRKNGIVSNSTSSIRNYYR